VKAPRKCVLHWKNPIQQAAQPTHRPVCFQVILYVSDPCGWEREAQAATHFRELFVWLQAKRKNSSERRAREKSTLPSRFSTASASFDFWHWAFTCVHWVLIGPFLRYLSYALIDWLNVNKAGNLFLRSVMDWKRMKRLGTFFLNWAQRWSL
jgi:hypothetical protein